MGGFLCWILGSLFVMLTFIPMMFPPAYHVVEWMGLEEAYEWSVTITVMTLGIGMLLYFVPLMIMGGLLFRLGRGLVRLNKRARMVGGALSLCMVAFSLYSAKVVPDYVLENCVQGIIFLVIALLLLIPLSDVSPFQGGTPAQGFRE